MLKRRTSRPHTHISMKHLRYDMTDLFLQLSGQVEVWDVFNKRKSTNCLINCAVRHRFLKKKTNEDLLVGNFVSSA